jgi:phage shock protein C
MRRAMNNRTGLYRSRHGIICGVCRGVAEYLDFSVFWTRMIAVALLIFTGLWPIVGIYLLAMLVMKPAPLVPFETDDEAEFYNSFTHSRGMAVQRLKRIYDKIDRRVQRMEDAVTAREYDWDQRLNRNL